VSVILLNHTEDEGVKKREIKEIAPEREPPEVLAEVGREIPVENRYRCA